MIQTRKLVEAFEIVKDYYNLMNTISFKRTGHKEEAYDEMIAEMQENIDYWKNTYCYENNL